MIIAKIRVKFIRIEKGSSLPISRQIADQVRALCLVGTLRPGRQLPSVRQLARELAVNQNTVLRVYERLSGEGLLEMRHGEGTFVVSCPPTERLNDERQKFAQRFCQLVRQGQMLGLTAEQLHALVDRAPEGSQPPPAEDAVTEKEE
ncbi:MAG: GntR family transcriptional regulator [Pirellulales bacterium]